MPTDGKVLWKKKLGIEQRQSRPFYADGKLYVAMYIAAAEPSWWRRGSETGGDGELFVIKPGDTEREILSQTKLTGKCYGSPIAYNGKLYVQTEKKLYCFGKKGNNPGLAAAPEPETVARARRKQRSCRSFPHEVLLKPGAVQAFRVRVARCQRLHRRGERRSEDR